MVLAPNPGALWLGLCHLGVHLGLVDVVECQAGKLGHDLLGRLALSQATKDHHHGDGRTGDERLAAHDVGSAGDGHTASIGSHGLVDEFRIWIVPVTHSPGQPLFGDVPETSLELTGTRTFASGVVVLTYVPATAPRPSSR